jgi:hypothetical protein
MSEYDPTDLSDENVSTEDRAKRVQLEQQNEIGDFKWLMSQKRGRRFVRRLIDFTGVHRLSMTGNSQTFFNEGQRNVGLKFMHLINGDDELRDNYVLMLKEHQDNVRHADDRQPNAQ